MPPSQQELARVKQSFEDLRPHHEPTSYDFYEELFARAPELRQLFRDDLKGQGMRFMNTLGLVLDDMTNPNGTTVDYAELGHLHTTLGVRQAHFEPMEDALMASLGKKLGNEFTADLEEAWRNAFRAFSKKLIEAGDIPA
ncbi:globin domain-containing protein [Tropicimonas isoalkanivorans]|uniref:Nitric oxide dioxygenase n=1 Tax=Tropicimonas isoalkanivorans TaxID=441112 RepID=A0A1I1PNT6_9RHOB|nr:globin domain-containing protein [Tropicimonas isoalkanivorans]SFD09308.1 nitric oxide dioxygenase [Tropicimonas isoalkanivorans]